MFHTYNDKLVECPVCKSPETNRFGFTVIGTQRYRCSGCHKTFIMSENGRPKYTYLQKTNILNNSKMFGVRATARANRLSTHTISKWQRQVEIAEAPTKTFHNMNYIPQESMCDYRITNIG